MNLRFAADDSLRVRCQSPLEQIAKDMIQAERAAKLAIKWSAQYMAVNVMYIERDDTMNIKMVKAISI